MHDDELNKNTKWACTHITYIMGDMNMYGSKKGRMDHHRRESILSCNQGLVPCTILHLVSFRKVPQRFYDR